MENNNSPYGLQHVQIAIEKENSTMNNISSDHKLERQRLPDFSSFVVNKRSDNIKDVDTGCSQESLSSAAISNLPLTILPQSNKSRDVMTRLTDNHILSASNEQSSNLVEHGLRSSFVQQILSSVTSPRQVVDESTHQQITSYDHSGTTGLNEGPIFSDIEKPYDKLGTETSVASKTTGTVLYSLKPLQVLSSVNKPGASRDKIESDSAQKLGFPSLTHKTTNDIGTQVEVGLNSEDQPQAESVSNVPSGDTSKVLSQKDSAECCGSQDCGVTVVPRTHESTKKCCSAVVPKKRKRHMEIKHMPKSKRRDRGSSQSSAPPSIVINFEESQEGFQGEGLDIYTEHSPAGNGSNIQGKAIPVRNLTQHHQGNVWPSSKQGSVIIHPGSTFSIPVSSAKDTMSFLTISGDELSKHTASVSPNTTSPDLQSEMPVSPEEDQQEKQSSAQKAAHEMTQKHGYSLLHPSGFFEDSEGLFQEKDPAEKTGRHGDKGLTYDPLAAESDPRDIPLSAFVPHEQHDLSLSEKDITDHVLESQSSVTKIEKSGLDEKSGGKKRRYPTSRPFKCDQCDHAFNQRIHLKKHQSKHTGRWY